MWLYPPAESGLTVTIGGVVVAPPGTRPTSLDWNWGDETAEAGCLYSPQTHTYRAGGTYQVTVDATFSDGSQLHATEAVAVAV